MTIKKLAALSLMLCIFDAIATFDYAKLMPLHDQVYQNELTPQERNYFRTYSDNKDEANAVIRKIAEIVCPQWNAEATVDEIADVEEYIKYLTMRFTRVFSADPIQVVDEATAIDRARQQLAEKHPQHIQTFGKLPEFERGPLIAAIVALARLVSNNMVNAELIELKDKQAYFEKFIADRKARYNIGQYNVLEKMRKSLMWGSVPNLSEMLVQNPIAAEEGMRYKADEIWKWEVKIVDEFNWDVKDYGDYLMECCAAGEFDSEIEHA